MDRLKLAVVSFGFLGLAPIAPGTMGTFGGVFIVLVLQRAVPYLLWTALVVVLLYAVGRRLGEFAEARAGHEDPAFFVLDEVIGYLIAVAWVRPPSLLAMTVGFLLFRFFDISKIWPMRTAERIGGGDGILLDDVVAGLYAFVVLTSARLLLLEPAHWVS